MSAAAEQRLPRSRGVPGTRLRIGDREQELAPRALVGAGVELERRQRRAIEPHRLLVREQGERAVARAPGIRERPAGVPAGDRVVRELGQVRPRIGAAERLERVHDTTVQPHAPRARQALVERVPDDHVREAQPSRAAGDLGDDARRERLVERLEHRVLRYAGELSEDVRPELAADDRCEHQRVAAGNGEVGDPAGDHVADALRHRRPGGALDGHEAHDLADEQRVAVRVRVQRGSERGRCAGSRRQAEVLGQIALAEAAEREHARERLTRDLGEHLDERLRRQRVDVTARADDQHPRRGKLADDEPEQQERGRVRRVQIVEHEHDRPLRRGGAKELGDRVEQPEARRLGIERRRRAELGEPLAQLRQDLRDVRSARPQMRAQRVRVGLAHVRTERLHPRPVGGRSAGLPAAAHQDACAPGGRARDQLLGEPALADPRLADEQERPPAAMERVVEAGEQVGELPRAADERGRRRIRAGRVGGDVVERRVLLEDRPLEVAQRPARLDAELLHQRAARRLVGVERVALAAAAVEAQHQLPLEALAERVLRRQGLQLPGERRMPAAGEVGVEAALQRDQPQIVEPRDLRLRERLVGEVGERRPAPQGERVAQRRRGRAVVRALRPGDEPLEARDVELRADPRATRSRARA